MAPILYGILPSSPVRSVILCANALGLNLDIVDVDLLNKGQLKPEFLKINPQHTVPVLQEDDGFILVDSHAIMTYLVDKYSEDKSLYPTDLRKRALVNHRLHFDSSILFMRGMAISRPILFGGEKSIPQDKLDSLKEAFQLVEKFLDDNEWVAGDQLTVADFSIVTSITSWTVYLPVDKSTYPKISRWLKRMEDLMYYKGSNVLGE